MALASPTQEHLDEIWPTVTEVLLRIQLDLDRPWSLEDAAALSGYEKHYFAHTFTAIVGAPPMRYVRLLRLERAACALFDEATSVTDVAAASGYQSADAFARAFRREFGTSPATFRASANHQPTTARPVPQPFVDGYPAGLSAPVIAPLAPLRAWTAPVGGFDLETFSPVLGTLLTSVPPDGPWQVGCLSQPWGWIGGAFRRDLRAARYGTVPESTPPPFLPWRSAPGWYATFTFEGLVDAVHPTFDWIMRHWVPKVGLRAAFLPMIGQMESLGSATVKARLHAPVLPVRGLAGTTLPST